VNEAGFQEEYARTRELERLARRVLEVDEGASLQDIRRAWRRRCFDTHPDRHPDDPDAERKFRMVECAYRLLTDGIPCDELLTEGAQVERTTLHGRYSTLNAWGFYVWWRETYF
jgi:hypothetical protein